MGNEGTEKAQRLRLITEKDALPAHLFVQPWGVFRDDADPDESCEVCLMMMLMMT